MVGMPRLLMDFLQVSLALDKTAGGGQVGGGGGGEKYIVLQYYWDRNTVCQ